VEWRIIHLFSCESPSLELNFCYLFINLGCGFFPGKAQLTPPILEVSCILPKVLSFYLCCFSSWSILLMRKPSRCSTSLIPRGVSHTFAPFPKPERPSFTPDRVTRGSLGGDQAPLLPLKGRFIIQTRILTSLMNGDPLPSLVPMPHQVPSCIQGLHPNSLGGCTPPLEQTVHWYLVGLPPNGRGDTTQQQGR
jgi:hypothetical protein